MQQALQDVLEVFDGAPRLDRQHALSGVDLAIQRLKQTNTHIGLTHGREGASPAPEHADIDRHRTNT